MRDRIAKPAQNDDIFLNLFSDLNPVKRYVTQFWVLRSRCKILKHVLTYWVFDACAVVATTN